MFFIYGKENYLAKAKLKELIESRGRGTNFELQKFEAEKMDLNEFKTSLNSNSLFAKKRLIIFENLSLSKEQKEISEWMKDSPIGESLTTPPLTKAPFHSGSVRATPPLKGGETRGTKFDMNEDIIIFFEENVDKKTSLYKFLKKSAENFEFEELKPFEVRNWAEKYVKENGGEIDRVALEELLMNNRNNLWWLSNELDKLLALNKKISLESVQELTEANFDDNIFNLTDAIGRGDKALALELLNKSLEKGLEPIYLLAMIVRQFRILLQIKDEVGESGYVNAKSVADKLNMHPFVVQKAIPQAQQYSMQNLKDIYEKLVEIDYLLKSSQIPAEVLFARLVVNAN